MDEKGLTKQVENFSEDDSTHPVDIDYYTNRLDDQDRIRSLSITSDSVVIYRVKNSYHKDESLTEVNEYRASAFTRNTSGLRQRITNYRYNQYGDTTLQTLTDPEGRLQKTRRQEFTYGEHGNWVQKTTYTAQYRFDPRNNYIERTVIVEEKPQYIIKREIAYY